MGHWPIARATTWAEVRTEFCVSAVAGHWIAVQYRTKWSRVLLPGMADVWVRSWYRYYPSEQVGTPSTGFSLNFRANVGRVKGAFRSAGGQVRSAWPIPKSANFRDGRSVHDCCLTLEVAVYYALRWQIARFLQV